MKKTFFLWLFIAAAFLANSQGSTLYEVNVVKPKAGMKMAFETSWKLHLDKFHKATDKRNVYEVTSGTDLGAYVIVEGPFSYADMDKATSNAKEHAADLDKNFTPKVETENENFMVAFRDTLSHNPQPDAKKVLVTVTVLKDGKQPDYVRELRRTAIILGKLDSKVSFAVLVKTQSGSSPTIITLRNLTNGYAELEANFFQNPPNAFRDAYVKEWGQEAWDKRVAQLVNDVVSREQHFEVHRADLSSPK
jgi:hypothetical protein